MPRSRPVVPRYQLHKASGHAYALVDGRRAYLGRHGTAESREKYVRLIRHHQLAGPAAAGPVPSQGPAVAGDVVTVAQVAAAFWSPAKRAYGYDSAYDGWRPPGETGCYSGALRPLLKLYASTPAPSSGRWRCRPCRRRWWPWAGVGTWSTGTRAGSAASSGGPSPASWCLARSTTG